MKFGDRHLTLLGEGCIPHSSKTDRRWSGVDEPLSYLDKRLVLIWCVVESDEGPGPRFLPLQTLPKILVMAHMDDTPDQKKSCIQIVERSVIPISTLVSSGKVGKTT